MLAVDFSGEKGETNNFILHEIFSFCLMVLAYTTLGFKTGFKRLKKTALTGCFLMEGLSCNVQAVNS